MGCHLSVKIAPEVREFVRKHSPTRIRISSPTAGMRGIGHARAGGQGFPSAKKVALLIGINKYHHWDALETAEKDACEVQQYFDSKGFQTTALLGDSATRKNIMQSLQNIHNARIAVVYFAGHGICGKNGPALVPIDAGLNSHDIEDKVSQDFLHGWSRRLNSHGLLLILDCCFGGNFCSKLRGSPDRPSFCIDQREKSRIVMSASLQNERVPDADIRSSSSHSPFTSALLSSLRDEAFSGSAIELFVTTRARAAATGNPILPKLGRIPGDEGGDVFFFA